MMDRWFSLVKAKKPGQSLKGSSTRSKNHPEKQRSEPPAGLQKEAWLAREKRCTNKKTSSALIPAEEVVQSPSLRWKRRHILPLIFPRETALRGRSWHLSLIGKPNEAVARVS
jgi:hypothetical protein